MSVQYQCNSVSNKFFGKSKKICDEKRHKMTKCRKLHNFTLFNFFTAIFVTFSRKLREQNFETVKQQLTWLSSKKSKLQFFVRNLPFINHKIILFFFPFLSKLCRIAEFFSGSEGSKRSKTSKLTM